MIPGYPTETAAQALPSAPAVEAGKEKPYRVGVLFVHGMGEQERGDTITQMGDALTEWLRQWIAHVPGADFKIRGAQLRAGEAVASDTPDDALGGQAHVAVTLFSPTPDGTYEQEWLLAESWWAADFRQATLLELVMWMIAAGPWLIASQRAGIGRRLRLNLVMSGLLTLVAALIAAVLTPFALALLVLSLVPVPVLSAAMRALAKNLTGSFGDLLILVRSPVRFAAMAEQVRADIAHVSSLSDRVLVVAHSQGSAVSWHAIRRTAERPANDRANVDRFLSFGQAFRKLKSLYHLHQASGRTQFTFALLALLSTVSLAVAALQGIGFWSVIIGAQGDLSKVVPELAHDWYWLRLLAPIALVLLIQGVLTRIARDNDDATEGEILDDIAEVRAVFPKFEWEDLWASADPAPNGPLLPLDKLPAGVNSYKIRNLASTILDHPLYWSNTTEFVSAVAFAAASLAPPSAIGVQTPIPDELRQAAVRRDHRVSMLAAGRVLLFGGLVAALYGLRHRLPDIGAWALDRLNQVPLLPDWFVGWDHIVKGFVGAGLLVVGASLLWGLIWWGWTLVIHDDEGGFFARRDRPPWTVAAIAWMAVAVVVPAAKMVALAIILGDLVPLVLYAVIVALGLVAVVLLNSPGRRLGDP